MPYVRRDFTGKIIGVFSCPQPAPHGSAYDEPEPVPEDDPEIVEFMKRFPVLTQGNMTEEDFRREKEDAEQAERDIAQLQQLFLQHAQAWTELETALSALFYAVLNIQPRSSQIPYAVYYGLNGFDARLGVVNNSILRLIDENEDLKPLLDLWGKRIHKKVQEAQRRRNLIVHGTIQNVFYGSKPRRKVAVLSPLPFDSMRMNKSIKDKGKPGLDVAELRMAVQKVIGLARCADAVNVVIEEFHQFGPATLPKTVPQLEARLTELNSQ